MSEKLILKLPSLDDNELLRLYKNCWSEIDRDSSRVEDARKLIIAVHAVWNERMKAAKHGQYKATTPEEGMLKALDHKVGNQGEPPHVRRKVLAFIMTERLPFVGSPAYMMQWGEPRSSERYNKLRQVLHNLHLKSMNIDRLEKASREWMEDRDWLIRQWNEGKFN